MKLKGKTVFITGAAKRIGAEIARYFAENGANVCIHYNSSESEALNLEKELLKFRVKVKRYSCDLVNTKKAVSVMQTAISDFGKIEFLINSASVFKKNSILKSTEEDFKRDFAIHTRTPFFLMQTFAKQKFENEEGFILNIIDKNTVRKSSSFTTYMLSKKSLQEITTFAAVEFAPFIRVNAISPGFILEEEGASKTEEYYEKKIAKIPLQRKGETEDIIKALNFLIKTNYITGENIRVDGGSFLVS